MKKNNFKIVELKPAKYKNSVKRTVFINDFIIEEIIGIHKHEKIKKQKIKFIPKEDQLKANQELNQEKNASKNEKKYKK